MTLRLVDENKVPRDAKADHQGRAVVTTDSSAPVMVSNPEGVPVESRELQPVAQTQIVSCSVQPTNTAATYTLPERNGEYLLTVTGQAVYIRTAHETVTAATASAGGHSFQIPEGGSVRLRLDGNKLSYIGTVATTGILSIVHLKRG